jgi:DNA polymerase III delta subunit
MLKTFYGAQVLSFKASKTLFSWLDLLGKKEDESKKLRLLHEAIKSDGDFFCFVMLIRQFRLLIQAKSNEKIAGAPFMITKLKTQAQNFSLEQLQKIYEQLLKFDYSQKTSTNLLSLNQWLDLLTLKL